MSTKNKVLLIESNRAEIMKISKLFLSNKVADKVVFFTAPAEAKDYIQSTSNSPQILPSLLMIDVSTYSHDSFEFLKYFGRLLRTHDLTCKVFLLKDSEDKGVIPSEVKTLIPIEKVLTKPLTFDKIASLVI
ncbi:hypothetical protein V6R21_18785 [Limibacter armeniacum]|uniref:hypothetical protein n=1 Tax=Limibacter armeniacum TaxID=466084 RepID=UPI002FE5522F